LAAHADTVWAPYARDPRVIEVLARNGRVRAVRNVGVVGSTQDVARDLAAGGGADGTVVIADRQVAGRGREGRRWDDDPGGGSLAVTLVLDARGPEAGLALLPHALGLAVLDTCDAIGVVDPRPRLKWPNDVVVRADRAGGSRKLAGILVERDRMRVGGAERDVLLCGVGLNVAHPSGGPADRVDLASLGGRTSDRVGLLVALLGALDGAVGALEDAGGVLARIRAASDTLGREVRVLLPGGTDVEGVATAIDDAGRLVVTTGSRRRVILSGTVRDLEEVR